MNRPLSLVDPQIYQAIRNETLRQSGGLELIASENFVSDAVLEALGSVMTNKYAEGYPGKRYYGGCQFVDVAESLAIERIKKLFNAEHANVQPHSGAQANLATYLAFINHGDTIMGLSLAHGGHLTHGHPVNFSGRLFNVISYTVDEKTETINYDTVRNLAKEHKPKLIIAGASAYPRTLDFPKFKEICDEVGAIFVVDMAHIAGLISAGLHPSPVPYADAVTSTTHKTLRGPRGGLILCKEQHSQAIDKSIFPGEQGGPLMHVISAKAVAFKEALEPKFKEYQKQIIANAKALSEELLSLGYKLVSGGTDTHLMLVNLTDKGLTGKKVESALEEVGITVNKNAIPFDTKKPTVTSGIRIGTPAITTRGMKEAEMKAIAKLISDIISNIEDENTKNIVKDKVKELCQQFPLYANRI